LALGLDKLGFIEAQYEVPGDVSSVAATIPLHYWRNQAGKIRSELSA
jgi:hypothetical protein